MERSIDPAVVAAGERAQRFAARYPNQRILGNPPPVEPINHVIEVDLARPGERRISLNVPTVKAPTKSDYTPPIVRGRDIVIEPWQTPVGRKQLMQAEQVTPNVLKPLVGVIQRVVADAAEITIEDLTGPRRRFAMPRQVAIVIVKQLRKDLSLPKIAFLFGNLDHTTVMHALKVIPPRMAEGQPCKALYEAAMEKIRQLPATEVPATEKETP